MSVWVSRKSMLRWLWWVHDDEINTSLIRFDSCAFAWLSYFRFWISCHEASNVFWKFETTTRRSFYVCSSFDTRFRIVFICRVMSSWDSCSSSNCRFALCSRFQLKASRIKRICVFSTWCWFNDVFFLAFESTCVWFCRSAWWSKRCVNLRVILFWFLFADMLNAARWIAFVSRRLKFLLM
jgi:hypothetical protein